MGITRNCSYEYFFGRGKLSDKIINSKILIIGVGAIGSTVATTLVRSGCTSIAIVDYDIKEPENVCRSEYFFLTGINNKVDDLSDKLLRISPFVEIGIIKSDLFHLYSKILHDNSSSRQELKVSLEKYDLIIDCSTDNDLENIHNPTGCWSPTFKAS